MGFFGIQRKQWKSKISLGGGHLGGHVRLGISQGCDGFNLCNGSNLCNWSNPLDWKFRIFLIFRIFQPFQNIPNTERFSNFQNVLNIKKFSSCRKQDPKEPKHIRAHSVAPSKIVSSIRGKGLLNAIEVNDSPDSKTAWNICSVSYTHLTLPTKA